MFFKCRTWSSSDNDQNHHQGWVNVATESVCKAVGWCTSPDGGTPPSPSSSSSYLYHHHHLMHHHHHHHHYHHRHLHLNHHHHFMRSCQAMGNYYIILYILYYMRPLIHQKRVPALLDSHVLVCPEIR